MDSPAANLHKPKPLQAGSRIRIVTPASPLTIEKIEKGKNLFEEWGYEVTLSKNIFEANGFLAGSDHDRADDLMEAFLDPLVDMVYCSRGGYGCARLLSLLDLNAMAASRKLFAGFSDITTLHIALNRRGLPTLHAPMPITLSVEREPWVFESLERALKGDFTVPSLAPRAKCLVSGIAEGEVTGGCLCLLCDTIGTPEPLETEGKILVIEDVDENPHRVDAMLTHLLNSGLAQKSAGIVVGEMTRTDEKPDEYIGTLPWRDIVKDRLGSLGIPLMAEYPFGHAANMLTLGLGIRARMDAEAGTLTYLEGLCA